MTLFELIIQDIGRLRGEMQPTLIEGCCPMAFGDIVLNLQCDQTRQRILVSGILAELPTEVPSDLLEELLFANLYWQAGATICLEPNSRSVLCLHAEPMQGLVVQDFLAFLENLSVTIATGREKIARFLNDVPINATTENMS